MQEYVNRDGVHVQAELVAEGDLAGLWHTVHEASGTEGHVTDEQFKRNWTPVESAPAEPVGEAPAEKPEE